MAIATVYEKYSDLEESTLRHRRPITTMGLFDQQDFTLEMHQPLCYPKNPPQYFFKTIDAADVHLELASELTEYVLVPVGEPGVTYTWTTIISPVVEVNLEQEFDLVVKMKPKMTRKVVVSITARNKGIPNPIL